MYDCAVVRSKPLTGHLGALLALLLVASAFWIHRMHGERPDAHYFLGNGDLYAYHYPTAVFIHNELRSGAIPLWNPYQLAGQPFAG